MTVRKYWVHSADTPEFNTPDRYLHVGEWAWKDSPANLFKWIYAGLDTHDLPAVISIDSTDPEWVNNELPQDRINYIGQRWHEIIVRVNFGVGNDLLRGQYSISPNDPDLRWVRYNTNKGRHHRYMAPESLIRDGPPQANLIQIASPVSEVFVSRPITETYYHSAGAGQSIAPSDSRDES